MSNNFGFNTWENAFLSFYARQITNNAATILNSKQCQQTTLIVMCYDILFCTSPSKANYPTQPNFFVDRCLAPVPCSTISRLQPLRYRTDKICDQLSTTSKQRLEQILLEKHLCLPSRIPYHKVSQVFAYPSLAIVAGRGELICQWKHLTKVFHVRI